MFCGILIMLTRDRREKLGCASSLACLPALAMPVVLRAAWGLVRVRMRVQMHVRLQLGAAGGSIARGAAGARGCWGLLGAGWGGGDSLCHRFSGSPPGACQGIPGAHGHRNAQRPAPPQAPYPGAQVANSGVARAPSPTAVANPGRGLLTPAQPGGPPPSGARGCYRSGRWERSGWRLSGGLQIRMFTNSVSLRKVAHCIVSDLSRFRIVQMLSRSKISGRHTRTIVA